VRAEKKVAFLAAALASLLACAQTPVEGFEWRDAEGASLSFRQAASWEAGLEGRFGPGRLENSYILEKAHETGEGRCLELRVTSSAAAEAQAALSIVLGAGSGRRGEASFAQASFPLRDRVSRFILPLPARVSLGQLSVALKPSARMAAGSLFRVEITAVAECVAFRGYALDAEGLRVSADFSFVQGGGESILEIQRPFAAPEFSSGASPGAGAATGAAPGAERQALVLEYGSAPSGARLVISGIKADGTGSDRTLRARAGGARIVLGRQAFPEGVDSLRLRAPVAAELRAFYVGAVSAADFELADLGRILQSAPLSPEADYDLYRWDLAPDVLVFDFRDYSVQDDYLKRLAFFVEKAGYRGSLQRDEVIRSLHGWNAHDYRSEDLAVFFAKARESGFRLNERERSLERLLVERGVLVERGGRIAPGRGAILSISRESPERLRRTFIVHESTHALYFANERYRAFAASRWAAMEPGEKWFWIRYFQWMAYDTKSEYLMANEYQAYLMQQPLAKVADYFTKTLPANLLVPEVLAREPELGAKVEAYMEEYGDRFAARAAELDAWLSREYGISAGLSYFLD